MKRIQETNCIVDCRMQRKGLIVAAIILNLSILFLHQTGNCHAFVFNFNRNVAFISSSPSTLTASTTIEIAIPRRSNLKREKRPSWIRTQQHQPKVLYSSFSADGSEYAASDTDYDNNEDDDRNSNLNDNILNINNNDEEQEDFDDDDENRIVPTIELQPVPISKNSGNRFVAILFDRNIQPLKSNKNDNNDYDVWDYHYNRIRCTEDHVMFCRKQNLYNTTFNSESMVDILWSLPMYVQ
jgi:hypothetical protein